MFVDSTYFADTWMLAKLLRCVPQVANLRAPGGTVGIKTLAQLQQLRRIRWANFSIFGCRSSAPIHLPQLQRLDTYNCQVEDSARQFLTPAVLPLLRHVDTDDLDIVAPLVRHLEIINCESDNVDYTILARAESLLLLPLPSYADERLDMLSKLPSLPPFLHVNIDQYFSRDHQEETAAAMEALLGTRKLGLRVILLNDYEVGASIKSLIQRFEERGVRVQLVDEELDFEGAIVEMEKIRAEEKRAAEAAALRGK